MRMAQRERLRDNFIDVQPIADLEIHMHARLFCPLSSLMCHPSVNKKKPAVSASALGPVSYTHLTLPTICSG